MYAYIGEVELLEQLRIAAEVAFETIDPAVRVPVPMFKLGFPEDVMFPEKTVAPKELEEAVEVMPPATVVAPVLAFTVSLLVFTEKLPTALRVEFAVRAPWTTDPEVVSKWATSAPLLVTPTPEVPYLYRPVLVEEEKFNAGELTDPSTKLTDVLAATDCADTTFVLSQMAMMRCDCGIATPDPAAVLTVTETAVLKELCR
jgi:hypothetical protein